MNASPVSKYVGFSNDPTPRVAAAFPSEVLLWNIVLDDGEGIFWGEARISTIDACHWPCMSDSTYIWSYSGEHRMVEAIVYLIRNGIKYTIIEDSEDFKAWPISDGWSDR